MPTSTPRMYTRRRSSRPSNHWLYTRHWLLHQNRGVLILCLWVFLIWILYIINYYNSSSSSFRGGNEPTSSQYAAITAASSKTSLNETLGFVVIGDFGTGRSEQLGLALTLGNFAHFVAPSPKFIVSTGDQVYEHGVESVNDPLFKKTFESVYTARSLDIPWYVSIGNHDCEGSIPAMLAYARKPSSRWKFPSRYYFTDHFVNPNTIVRIIVLDVCDLVCGKTPRDFRCIATMNAQSSDKTRTQQYEWMEKVMAMEPPEGVANMWKVVVGHWSVYSYAGNGDTTELIQNLEPLLKKYHVHAYFNGHDHCLQHIHKLSTTGSWSPHYFVSGAGGFRLHDLVPNARADPDLIHAATTHGFMWVRVTSTNMLVQFLDSKGEIAYTTNVNYKM